MPNAGIHGTRSTIWKSAEDASNPAHSRSVNPKAASEATSATWRTSSLRDPSRFGMTRSRTAAASGSATIEERIGNVIRLVAVRPLEAPHVVPEHRDDAEEHRSGVHADRARLQPAQYRAARADKRPGAVHQSVDHARVNALPEQPGRQALDRLNDTAVVQLVDVVLVQQQPVQWCGARGHAVGRARAADEEVPGEADTCDGDDARDQHQRPLDPDALVAAAHVFSGGWSRGALCRSMTAVPDLWRHRDVGR